MATAYTSILKLALPVQGELSGTWGDVVNDNITSMVEEAIAGRAVINTWTTNSHTLTSADGTTSESRCAMLEFTDTGTALTGDATVICPTAAKIYICKNDAGQKVTIKTSAGTGVAIADGQTMFVFCDGTNVVEAVTSMSSLKLGTAVTSIEVTSILDEDDLVSDSATALATQQSIKAYVDAQVTAQDLDFGGDSGTGSVDLDSQTFTIAGTSNEIETSASGQTLTVGLPAAVTVTTSVTTPTVQVTDVKANDGTAAVSIADSTGQTTITDAVLTTADINGGTADNVVIGGTTAAAGSFTTVGATGNITSQGQVITDTINEQTATSGVTVDGVLLKDGGATLTGDLTVDTDTLYVDSTNNNVGIGESSPVNIANYVGLTFSDTTGGFIRFKNDAGTQGAQITGSGSNLSIETIPALPIIFYTNSTEAMRIDSSGNVLVGTTSGTNFVDKMRVVGDTNGVDFGGSSSTGVVRVRGSDTGAALIDFTKLSVNPNSSPFYNGRIFYSFNDHFMRFETNAQEAMRIDSSGNVGIGTSSPAVRLDVEANTAALLDLTRTGVGSYRLAISSSDKFSVYDVGEASDRLVIDSSGNVGIGTSSPSNPFEVIGSVDTNVATFSTLGDGGGASNRGISIATDTYGGSIRTVGSGVSMGFDVNGSERMRIDSIGNVGIGTSSPAAKLTIAEDLSGPLDATAFRLNASSANDSNTLFGGPVSSGNYSFFQSYKEGTSAGVRALALNPSGGNVGIGTSSPDDTLTVGGETLAYGNALGGRTLGVRGGVLGGVGGDSLNLAYFGYESTNNNTAGLNLKAFRTATGNDWTTTALKFTFNVDNTDPVYDNILVFNSGRIGIGTSSPDELLHIHGSTQSYIKLTDNDSGQGATDGALFAFDGGSATQYIWNYENGPTVFATNSSERMRIDSSGNVGIGVAPNSANGSYLQFANGYAAHQHGLSRNTYFDGSTYRAIYTGGATLIQGGDDYLFYTAPSVTAGDAQTFVERVRITNDGRLAVRDSTPHNSIPVSVAGWSTENALGGPTSGTDTLDGARISLYAGNQDHQLYMGDNGWEMCGNTTSRFRFKQGTSTSNGDVVGTIKWGASGASRWIFGSDTNPSGDSANTVPLAYFDSTGTESRNAVSIKGGTSGNNITTIIATNGSYASSGGGMLYLGCRRAASSSYSFGGWYSSSNGTLDREFNFRGDGQAYADGSWNGGGADYAEYFEWADGNPSSEDRRGMSVVLVNEKIRVATADDPASSIIGVVSAMPAVVGDTAWNHWSEQFLRDDFGAYRLEAYTLTEWEETISYEETDANGDLITKTRKELESYETDRIPSGVTPPADAQIVSVDDKGNTLMRRVLNPDYDPTRTYVPREDRPEWDAVGMVGKLRIRLGQPTGDRWIKLKDISANVEEWLIR